MKTETKVRITNENVRITAENVQHIGECIALSAIKKMMRFAHHPKSLDKLYAGLVEDVYGNRGYNTTFSDGYDLASEEIYFLCHYMGHNLDDLACQNSKGELLTIRFACYRHALRYIEKEYLSVYKTISIEECSPADASIDFETQYEIEDYTSASSTVKRNGALSVKDMPFSPRASTLEFHHTVPFPLTAMPSSTMIVPPGA